MCVCVRSASFFALTFFYNFLKRINIDLLFRRLEKNSRSFLLFSLFHLSLSSASSTVRSRTVSSVSVFNSFLRLLYLLFLPTSYRPSEHKVEASHPLLRRYPSSFNADF